MKRVRGRIIVSVILIVFVLAAGFVMVRLATTSVPTGTPSGELAFMSDRGDNWDIFTLDSGGRLRNLTADDAFDDYFPSWDFASERINFLSGRIGELGPTQIEPDGSGMRTLSILDAVTTMFFESRFDWDPHWSPDGRHLVFASLRDLNLELYLADRDDNRTKLTSDSARDWFAAWSPDSSKIVFGSDRAGNEDIYMMDADGANLRQITTDAAADIRACWSLDGQTLLFVSERQNDLLTGQMDFYVVPADGDESAVKPLAEGEIFEGCGVWSADGAEMAFMSNRDGKWSIYLQDAAGENLRRLTDDAGNDLFPVWRP